MELYKVMDESSALNHFQSGKVLIIFFFFQKQKPSVNIFITLF